MSIKDELGNRMKTNYEQIPKLRLTRRTPVIIRIDGKAFHSYTRGFQKPFDTILMRSMQETMKSLCKNIQGCVLGYTQSDEISLLLVDYRDLNSQAWFDNEVQKICSISASMATMVFNKEFTRMANNYIYDTMEAWNISDDEKKYMKTLEKAMAMGAMFDSRCFNIPKEEVTNYFYWRQQDATRNSSQMVGQANFSHTELQGKSCNEIQDMLHEQRGINWNDFPTRWKRGVACYREKDLENNSGGWVVDYEMPILKGENRAYVDNLIFIGE